MRAYSTATRRCASGAVRTAPTATTAAALPPRCGAGGHASRPHLRSRLLTLHVAAFKPAYFPPPRLLVSSDEAPPARFGNSGFGGDELSQSQAATSAVSLPLDYYACLGLKSRAAGPHAVRQALDNALTRPPDADFSADTLSVRSVLLRTAADCLLDMRTRKGYDAMGSSVDGYTVEVGTQYLPGGLVLLQECGRHELVLELGTQWLADSTADSAATRDVAAAMALSHHALATQVLAQEEEEQGGAVSDACRHLEAALLLLRRARRAGMLQQEVAAQLEELSPHYCLELLAAAGGHHEPLSRARGLLLLRKLVFADAELSPLGADRDAFLQYARALLTPEEYLALFKGVPRHARSLEQQLDVAAATVAIAFRGCKPLLMAQAASAYQQLEKDIAAAQAAGAADAGSDGGPPDVSVCRASCALLMGDTPQALQLLGLGQGSGAPRADVLEYVQAHSPDASDLLPGVYALAQCWMQEAVLDSFRQPGDEGEAAAAAAAADAQAQQQPQQQPVQLSTWFEARHVQLFVMALTAAARLRLWLLAIVNLRALTALPAAMAALLAWVQQRVLPPQPPRVAVADGAQAGVAKLSSSGSMEAAQAAAAVQSGLEAEAEAEEQQALADGQGPHEHADALQLQQQDDDGSGLQEEPVHLEQQQQEVLAATDDRETATSPAPPARRSKSPVLQRLDAVQLPEQPSPALSEERPEAVAVAAPTKAKAAPKLPPSAAAARGSAPRSAFAVAASRLAGSDRATAAAAAAAAEDATNDGSSGEEGGSSSDAPQRQEDAAALRARLETQMKSLEVQMWDVAPQPAWVERGASALRAILLVGATLLCVFAARQAQQGRVARPGAGQRATVMQLRPGA